MTKPSSTLQILLLILNALVTCAAMPASTFLQWSGWALGNSQKLNPLSHSSALSAHTHVCELRLCSFGEVCECQQPCTHPASQQGACIPGKMGIDCSRIHTKIWGSEEYTKVFWVCGYWNPQNVLFSQGLQWGKQCKHVSGRFLSADGYICDWGTWLGVCMAFSMFVCETATLAWLCCRAQNQSFPLVFSYLKKENW